MISSILILTSCLVCCSLLVDSKPSAYHSELGCLNCGSPPVSSAVSTAVRTDAGSVVSLPEVNAVLRPGQYVPNCGCVPRGACQREIGEYTLLVAPYSDVVCGTNYDKCCFDGPCPGILDEFVRAAPCVPVEKCLRPYGVLPTDVRDFGIIAPCPGHGAVRCIAVDDSALLEFQAAIAAIEASSVQFESVENTVPVAQTPTVNSVVSSVSSEAEVPAVVAQTPTVNSVSSVYSEADVPAVVAQTPTVNSFVSSVISEAAVPAVVAPTPTVNSVSSVIAEADVPAAVAPTPTANSISEAEVPAAVQVPIVPPAPFAYSSYYPGIGFGFRKSFHFSKGFGLYGK